MRLPMWLKRRKGKNPFEGSLIVDNPDIKVVEATYDTKPVLLAVGTSKQRELKVSGKGNTDGLGAQYRTQKDLDWQVLFNPKALPDFIPIEKAKELMAGTIAVSSGSAAVFSPKTEFKELDKDKLDYLERDTHSKLRQNAEGSRDAWKVYVESVHGQISLEREKKKKKEESES